MKFRKLFAFLLAIMLMVNTVTPALAANDLGVSYSAVMSPDTLNVSDMDQTFTVTINANKEFEWDSVGFKVIYDAPLVLVDITNTERTITGAEKTTNKGSGVNGAGFMSESGENEYLTNICVLTFSVPAGTQEGDYIVGIDGLEITKDYGDYWEYGDTVTATLKVEAAAVSTYKLSIDGVEAEPREEGADLSSILTKDLKYYEFYKDEAKTQPVTLTEKKMPAHDLHIVSKTTYKLVLDGEQKADGLLAGVTIADKLGGTLENFRFFSDEACTSVFNVTEDKMPAQDLYAKTLYTLTFQDEEGETISSGKYVAGETISAPAYTAPEGYVFKAWVEDAEGSPAFDFTNAVMPARNLTVSAQVMQSFNVILKNGDEDVADYQANKDNNFTITINVDDPTKDGYTFKGWTDGTNYYKKGDAVSNISADLVLTAAFEINCSHATTKPVPNNDGTHDIVCTNTACGHVVKDNEKCAGGTATCSAEAECSTCGAKYGEKDADNHNWKLAGYTNNGSTHSADYLCLYDATHTKSEPNLPHNYVDGVCVCEAVATYSIKWVVNGETTATTVEHGKTPVFPGSTEKADTAEWDYTFTGWSPAVVPATSDATYTAQYSEVKKSYTISWDTDGDGDVDTTTTVAYGDIPAYEGTPSKAATAEYSYTFTGWSPAVTAVTGEATYTAQFEAVPNTYKVIYMVNGEKVHEDSFDYSAAVTAWAGYTAPEGYTFDGWDNVPATMPAGDVTVTGTITIKSYTITWKVEGQDDVTTTVNHGETPAYEGTPAKESTAQYTYTFAGWTPEVVAATGDKTYTAQFTPVLRSYDITFVVDGQEDKVVSTKYGEKPVYGADPTKASDTQYSYTFAGWDKDLAEVTGEATYTATWTKTPVEYTITFVIDGVEGTFYQVKGGYGTAVDTSDMPSTAKTGYTWNGWDTIIPETFFAENIVITGSYTINQYTITFKGDFNTEKDDAFVDYEITKNYGEAITAEDIAALNATLPTITGWELQGWYYAEEVEYEEADEPVWKHTDEYQIPATMGAEDVTVYAKWDAIVYELTVKSSIDDKAIATSSMRYEEQYHDVNTFNEVNHFHYTQDEVEDCFCEGNVLTPEGYTFAGYKYADGTEMTFPIECWPAEEVTIIAQFKPIDYTITFMNGDEVYDEITAAYGSAITLPAAPTKEGYVFAGWVDAQGNAVSLTTMPLDGMTVFATFAKDSFKLNFFATEGDAAAVATFNVVYGTELTEEYVAELLAQVADPSKAGYTWTGWDTTNVPATMPAGAVNIYGTWSVNSYNVVWTIDGEAYTTTSVAYGEAITEPTEPTKEGYTFSGWSTIPATMPAEDVTVNGSWQVNQYTITFDTDGGNETIDSITADYGTAITWPAYPTKTGHMFFGWDKDNDGVGDIFTLDKMPAENLNLKAVWLRSSSWIYWNVEGQETGKEYKYGDVIEMPADPTKAADEKWTYKFVGWKDISDNMVEFPQTVTENMTYYAVFEQDEAVKYTVKFVAADDADQIYYQTQIAWNGEVTLDGFEAPAMEGNTLTWTVDGEEVTFPYAMTTADVTFVAKWTVNTYTITVDGEVKEFTYGAAISIADPTKEGHTFNGWLKDGIEGYYTLPETMPAEDIVITSAWTVNTHTLTVMYSDAYNNPVEQKLTVPYGAKLSEVMQSIETPDFYDSNNRFYEFKQWEYFTDIESASWVDYTGETMPDCDLYAHADYYETGWINYEGGEKTYIVRDEDIYGWHEIDGAWYYFVEKIADDPYFGQVRYSVVARDIMFLAKDGVEGYYAFDHESGKWLNTYTGIYTAVSGDLYYVENGIAAQNKGLVRVYENGEAKYYYFGCGHATCTKGCDEYKAQKNTVHWVEKNNDLLPMWDYTFGADGAIIYDDELNNNAEQTHKVVKYEGVKYYTIDGIKVHWGLFIGEDDEYYYARSTGELVVSRDYWISDTHLNGVERNGQPVAEGMYTFDAEGRIEWPVIVKNGVYKEGDKLFYYVDGERNYAGLIKITGGIHNEDGSVTENVYADDYIYVRTSGELAIGKYWTTKHNGEMKAASYDFDAQGRMPRKNGLIQETDGLFYYINGNRYYAGLIKIDGSYYYIRTSGQAVTGTKYWISKTNDLMPEKSYTFGDDGKMLDPVVAEPAPEGQVKNGIVAENGSLYYYVDGKLNYAGLIKIDGNYYYVRTSGELVVGRSYWVTKNNGEMKSASYQFDENGVMINPAK